MFSLRLPWIWWGIGFVLVLGVCVGSLLPAQLTPGIPLRDKVQHAAAYLLLMVWFAGMYRRRYHAVIAVLLVLLGLALDLAQSATVTRSFELADVAANTGGILAGLLLARFFLEGWCLRVERLVGLS